MAKLLLVSLELAWTQRHSRALNHQTLTIHQLTKISTAQKAIATGSYQLLILDWSIGENSIHEFLDSITDEKLSTLVLILGKNISLTQRLAGLERGVDLWLQEPLHDREFVLQVKNLLQKERVWSRQSITVAGLTHYYLEGIVQCGTKRVKLRVKENKILECLTLHQNRVIPRWDLLRYVWPNPVEYPNPDTIDVYIRRIRMKLSDSGANIKTYRGFGYRLEPATQS
jgi:two-component system OmpR family response regulator